MSNKHITVHDFILIPLLTAILVFNSIPVLAGQTAMPLNNGWLMKTGDNPAWAKADFDDSGWQPVRVGVPWEKAGHADYDGYAWYRLKLDLPNTWKRQDENGFLSLSLGFIDDADVTYFNGEKIGATGSMPPDYKTGYYTKRFYRVPTRLVRWGDKNVLAVRVYDGYNEGGLVKGPFLLKLPAPAELFDVQFKLTDSNGITFSPDSLPATVNIKSFSHKPYQTPILFELLGDRVDSIKVFKRRERTINLGPNQEAVERVKFMPPSPGFYKVRCTLMDSISTTFTFGYDPEKIVTPLTRQPDFEEFWQKRKKELAGVDPQFKMTKSDRSTDQVDVYLVEMHSYGNVRIRGWYTVPKKPGPHPAILSVPGYTSTMWPYVRRTNVATFALNPRGHGNSKDDVDPKGEEYMFIDFDPAHPENYIYAGAFMDCVRAVDFLASRPEIDKLRIGVEGGSQGGGLSFATAALDSRIMFCAPDIPWMGDWVGYLQTEYWGWKNYPKLFERYPDLTFDGINRFLSYFDTMNMAEWITCPVLMSVGLQDKVCPPRTSFATYNAVKTEKEYRVYPFAGHGTWQQHEKIKDAWMARQLGVDKIGED